jgi:hypothetical protein
MLLQVQAQAQAPIQTQPLVLQVPPPLLAKVHQLPLAQGQTHYHSSNLAAMSRLLTLSHKLCVRIVAKSSSPRAFLVLCRLALASDRGSRAASRGTSLRWCFGVRCAVAGSSKA